MDSVGCILGFQENRTWVQSLTLPPTSCVVSDKASASRGFIYIYGGLSKSHIFE